MSYIKSLPKTSFLLPDNSVVESVNIFKSILFSEKLKENEFISKNIFYDQVKRIEKLSYDNYNENYSFYWIPLLHNNILSFSDLPKQQIRFEINLKTKTQGTIYYIKNAINALDVNQNDLLLMQTETDWKFGGVVKEYDPVFRRIILKKEFENTTNSEILTDNRMYIYRKINNDSYSLITSEILERGKTEKEIDKILKIFDSSSRNKELSPYVKIISGEISEEFDFSNSPSNETVIYNLCNDTLNNFNYYRLLENELYEIATKKKLKFFNTGYAFYISSFFDRIKNQNFDRGQQIDIQS